MDLETLNGIHALHCAVAEQADWRSALDALVSSLRKLMVFDNIAVYWQDPKTQALEVVYARALGRGKTAEADAAWGEGIAAQVIAAGTEVFQEPTEKSATWDRIGHAFLYGLPLSALGRLGGALVLVRFGGPLYNHEHTYLAGLAATLVGSLFERRALQETRAQLESLQSQIRLQDDFVATISHELRTPLGFIKGYSTTLLRQDTTWDKETQREFLTIIDEETDRLARLIENILESARLQSKTLPLRFQEIRMDALIRDVVQRAEGRHKNLAVELDFEPADSIQGDSLRLVQVFENLFTNAVKYAPGSKVTIRLRKVDQVVQVRFSDQGPGIPHEHLTQVFERFYRAPHDSSSVVGTGLGLYICKQIILAHRGKIWVESAPGQGATFVIELPVGSVG
jgi:two-component system sensor histidine kinase KdpD